MGDDPDIVLDQYLGGEELEEVILKEGNVIDNNLPRTSRIEMSSMISKKQIKHIIIVLKIVYNAASNL